MGKEILIKVGLLLRDELESDSVVTTGRTLKPDSEWIRIVDLDRWNKIVDTLCKGEMPDRVLRK